MPTLRLSPQEAKVLAARRKRAKGHNATIYKVIDHIKRKAEKVDPLEAATLNGVLGDLRKMLRL